MRFINKLENEGFEKKQSISKLMSIKLTYLAYCRNISKKQQLLLGQLKFEETKKENLEKAILKLQDLIDKRTK